MPGILEESAILNWVSPKAAPRDVFSGSVLARWVGAFVLSVTGLLKTKTAKAAAAALSLGTLAYIGWTVSWIACLAAVMIAALSAVIWKRPDAGLALLIFSCALTPKLYVGTVNTVIVPLRIDDIVLAVMTLAMLSQISFKREEARPTPLDVPVLLFVGAMIVATFRGVFIQTIDKPVISILYVAKVVQYFLIFFVTVFFARDARTVRLCVGAVVASALIVSLLGIWEHFHPFEVIGPTNYYRLYERGLFRSESNHFGGYFVFLIGLAGGFMLFSRGLKERVYWLLFSLLALFPLLWTFSRISYCALAASVTTLILLAKKRRSLLVIVLVVCALGMFLALTQPLVKDRIVEIRETLLSRDPHHSSVAFRFEKWHDAFSSFSRYPLFGTGLGSRHRAFYEGNQVLVLSELGIAGYVLFWVVLLTVLRETLRMVTRQAPGFLKGLDAGFLAGFIGLIVHSFTCNSFMITRITGPFWIVAALVFAQRRRDDVR